jgi:hypothetical protein
LGRGGLEEQNGDNLVAIYDEGIATAFAIEAIGLVDHFAFLDSEKSVAKSAPASWYHTLDGVWAQPYFDSGDLHCVDRELFSYVIKPNPRTSGRLAKFCFRSRS